MVTGIHNDDPWRARRSRRRGRGLYDRCRPAGCRRGAAAGVFRHTTMVVGSLLEGAAAKPAGSDHGKGHVGKSIVVIDGNGGLEEALLALVVQTVINRDFPAVAIL